MINKTQLRFKFLTEYSNKFDVNFNDFENYHFKYIYENLALSLSLIDNSSLLVEDEENNPERDNVISLIKQNQFDVNNIGDFVNSAFKGNRNSFLSKYSQDEYKTMTTYKLKGYDIGYAIKNDGDIVSVFNNSGIKNIGEILVKSAINNGGTKLDHYEGYLSKLYEPLGFKETERYKWDNQYAPDNWDYEKYGKPDVVMRQLQN